MGRGRVDSRVTAERRVYSMLALTQRRTPAQQAADARDKAAGERVYKDSELVPIGKVARVVRAGSVATLELAPMRALDADLAAVGRHVCVLGRGDSIMALVRVDAEAQRASSSSSEATDVAWRLVLKDATAIARLSPEKLKGARVYVPYASLTTAAARDAARAFAAELPKAWVTTMVADVK